jgi:DNA-binding response OmpR family regulator
MLIPIRALFVEDHKLLCDNLAEFFIEPEYRADFARDGLTALHLIATQQYDIIVLDVNLPAVKGTDICRQIRNQMQLTTPVIFLTAMDGLDDKLLGFQLGADDYLTKPFDLRELAARISARVKRQSHRENKLECGDICYFPGRLLVSQGTKTCQLTGLAAQIFEHMMRKYPEYSSFHDLAQSVWQNDEVDDNTIRTQIYSLRKLLDKTLTPGLIKSVHGIGYRISAETIKAKE